MRTWEYCELGPDGEHITVRITDEQILKKYWNFITHMAKSRGIMINRDNCVSEFVAVHCAHEVKGDK